MNLAIIIESSMVFPRKQIHLLGCQKIVAGGG
jgi:hypothetical protein